jgi:hypothetical protein
MNLYPSTQDGAHHRRILLATLQRNKELCLKGLPVTDTLAYLSRMSKAKKKKGCYDVDDRIEEKRTFLLQRMRSVASTINMLSVDSTLNIL